MTEGEAKNGGISKRDYRKFMRVVILAQCTGMMGSLIFKNGFLLSYLSRLGISSSDIIFYLSLPQFITFLLTLFLAHTSDRLGKKRLGIFGLSATVAGHCLLSAAPFAGDGMKSLLVGGGVVMFGIGIAGFACGWFALLAPLVPAEVRGRFFGTLRLSWQVVGIFFTMAVTAVLKYSNSLSTYLSIMAVIIFLGLIRIYYYMKIPELDRPDPEGIGFKAAFLNVLSIPNYLPFCSYTFLLTLFTGACPWIFGLLEKDVLGFTSSRIVLMGNLIFVGALLGYHFGGKVVDRWGARAVFIFCHFSFGISLFLFACRDILPFPTLITVGILSTCFGMVQAASGIAITTEMMTLIPETGKSLSTSLNFTLQAAGTTFSGMIAAKIMEYGILSPEWVFMGLSMSAYDTLLLGCALMVTLLVVTLGLIPSVTPKKSVWIPTGS